MLDPSIDTLLELVDSKYSLVVGAAKRARDLGVDANKILLKQVKSNKYVGVALEEIQAGKVSISRYQEES